jgi:regulator of replication initiation timing
VAKTLEEMRKELEGLKAKAALPSMSDEERERAKLRSELAQAKARLAAKEAEARAAKEDELFEEIEGKHPGESLHRIDTDSGMIVMRAPTYAKSRVFQQVALRGKLGPDAIEDFVKPCVVYPEGDELEERLEKHALLAAQLCQFAQEIGSDEAKRRQGK